MKLTFQDIYEVGSTEEDDLIQLILFSPCDLKAPDLISTVRLFVYVYRKEKEKNIMFEAQKP